MNISYVNSNKTTSLPVELDALNNKDISYAKDFSLTLEFNDTIIESQKVTGNKAKHILEDIEIFYRNKPDTYY